jgi:hypothetical protein
MIKRTFATTVIAASMMFTSFAYAVPGTNPLPRTGQGQAGKCYDSATAPAVEIPCTGTKQDGETRKGVAWPGTRFTDNSNGTVTDNLTGLIWLKDITCLGMRNLNEATAQVAVLANATCGLTDGSTAGTWRLPNAQELKSLVDINYYGPALTPGHPFILLSGDYSQSLLWSSTPFPGGSGYYVAVRLYTGDVSGPGTPNYNYCDSYGCHHFYYNSANLALPVKNSP